MSGKGMFRALALTAVVVLLPSIARSAPPWGRLITFSRVEADAGKEYWLTDGNGPWVIMACSFSGEKAEEEASELVLELRRRYKLPAFMHRMKFEFGETQGRGFDRYGDPVRMRHSQDDIEEVAVLVGNFPTVDDPEAQRILQKLKYSTPKCLELSPERATARSLAGLRFVQQKILAPGNDKKEKGPMGHAFVTTNPLLPKEFFTTKGLDPIVVDMNKNVTHGLLDCSGKFTVQVATFKGSVVLDQKEIAKIEQGKQMESALDKAARKAHEMTEALRLKGWEAYEFHDRYASIVTVGSFDSVGSPCQDGRIELHPGIQQIMKTFGAEPVQVAGKPGTTTYKSIVGIPFDIQPVPVQVPKRSISQELAGGLF